MLHSFSFNVRILSEVHLNLRRHVSANVTQVEGPGGAYRRCDCDGYRPDTLEAYLGVKERFCPAGLGSTPHILVHRLSG